MCLGLVKKVFLRHPGRVKLLSPLSSAGLQGAPTRLAWVCLSTFERLCRLAKVICGTDIAQAGGQSLLPLREPQHRQYPLSEGAAVQ